MRIEALAQCEGGRATLPIPYRYIVRHEVPGDYRPCLRRGHVATANSDDERQLRLIVELVRDARQIDRIRRPGDAADLLIEPELTFRCRYSGRRRFRSMGAVIHADRQKLLRVADRRAELHIREC